MSVASPTPNKPQSKPQSRSSGLKHFLRAGDRLLIGGAPAVVTTCMRPEPGATDTVVIRIFHTAHTEAFHRLTRHVLHKNGEADILWFLDDDQWPVREPVIVVDRKFVAARVWHD